MAKNNDLNNSSYEIVVETTVVAENNIECTSGNITVSNGSCFIWDGDFTATSNSDDSNACAAIVRKERDGATVIGNDGLGLIAFRGWDGTLDRDSSRILSHAQTTIGLNKVPGAIFFQTKSDDASPITSRCYISKDGSFLNFAPLSGVALTVNGSSVASGTIRASSLHASGDSSGVDSTIALTNVVDISANGAGTFTIKSKSGSNLDSSGFVKIYVGTDAYYIPAFTSVAP